MEDQQSDSQSQQAAIQATGLAPSDDRESVVMAELGPASYTAIVRGKNDTTGVGVVEVYDVNQTADSKLANISTRGNLDTPDSVMIAGVIIGSGNGAAKLLVRVLGRPAHRGERTYPRTSSPRPSLLHRFDWIDSSKRFRRNFETFRRISVSND